MNRRSLLAKIIGLFAVPVVVKAIPAPRQYYWSRLLTNSKSGEVAIEYFRSLTAPSFAPAEIWTRHDCVAPNSHRAFTTVRDWPSNISSPIKDHMSGGAVNIIRVEDYP